MMARYQFQKIPNTTEGKELVRLMRKYLNRDVYKLTCKGQNLDSDNHDWKDHQFGSPMYACKNLRVYIDERWTPNDRPTNRGV